MSSRTHNVVRQSCNSPDACGTAPPGHSQYPWCRQRARTHTLARPCVRAPFIPVEQGERETPNGRIASRGAGQRAQVQGWPCSRRHDADRRWRHRSGLDHLTRTTALSGTVGHRPWTYDRGRGRKREADQRRRWQRSWPPRPSPRSPVTCSTLGSEDRDLAGLRTPRPEPTERPEGPRASGQACAPVTAPQCNSEPPGLARSHT